MESEDPKIIAAVMTERYNNLLKTVQSIETNIHTTNNKSMAFFAKLDEKLDSFNTLLSASVRRLEQDNLESERRINKRINDEVVTINTKVDNNYEKLLKELKDGFKASDEKSVSRKEMQIYIAVAAAISAAVIQIGSKWISPG